MFKKKSCYLIAEIGWNFLGNTSLAKKMILASGLEIKDKKNKNGDIEIEIIGIKEGEKLKEELLINGKIVKTVHPLINKAEEKIKIDFHSQNKISQIIDLAKTNNKEEALQIFNELVNKYK